jgi:acyl-homoserine lactone acylase PvdQ
MSGYRLSQIDNVYEHHIDRLEGNDFVQLLTDTITSEVSLLLEQIVSYADNKKAELDAAAASRAKQVLDNAKERAS